MFGTNPNLIQAFDADPWDETVPLILIHDGGGTIYSYYCLGELGRPVYGIFNPSYSTRQPWAGGIVEMASHYANLIRDKVVPQGGPVILGGWSLGGMLSLQVAHELAKDGGGDPIKVLGIVMVDSACPMVTGDVRPMVVQHLVQWGENTQQQTKEAVSWCFDQAIIMLPKWQLPLWDDMQRPGGQCRKVRAGADGARDILPKGPPPVVLLKAVDNVPKAEPKEEGVCRADIHRKDDVLGWRQYRADLIHKVVEIPGHHFNIFSTEDNLQAVTEKLKEACRDIEDLSL